MKYGLSRPKVDFAPFGGFDKRLVEARRIADKVTVVESLLHETECSSLIEAATPMLESVDWEYEASYRSCHR